MISADFNLLSKKTFLNFLTLCLLLVVLILTTTAVQERKEIRKKASQQCLETPQISLSVDLDSGTPSCTKDDQPTWRWQPVKGNNPPCEIVANKLYRNWIERPRWRDWPNWVSNRFIPQKHLTTANNYCVRANQKNQAGWGSWQEPEVCVNVDTSAPQVTFNNDCSVLTVTDTGCAGVKEVCYFWHYGDSEGETICQTPENGQINVSGRGETLYFAAKDKLGNISTGVCPSSGEFSYLCRQIYVYDDQWNYVSDPNTLQPGQTVRFLVRLSTANPAGAVAKFRINNGRWQEATGKRGGEYYYEYTLPDSGGSFVVEAKVEPLPRLD